MEESKVGYKDIFRQKEFMKTVIAAVINRFGDSIDSIAFAWLVYQLTQSASWSAIIFGINRIPTIFLQPFAGAAVEGKNKKLIMIVTDVIRGVCVGIVATTFLTGHLNQWILLTLTVVISCAEAFRGPASSALLPKLLKKEYYTFGISLNTSVCSVTELIGFAVAGAIIATFSVSAAIYIDMATFFLSAFIILTLRVEENILTKAKINAGEYIQSLKGGFTYLKENALLRYFAVFAVFLNGILVPFNSLQAPLVSEVLHTDERMLSVLSIGITIGMICGAVCYPYLSNKISKKIIISLAGYSIAMYYISLVVVGQYITNTAILYLLIFLTSFLVGIAISLLTSFYGIEFMKSTDTAYLARVSSIFGACCVAAIPVGSFVVSVLAGFVSTQIIFLIAGILDIIVCLVLCSKKKLSFLEAAQKERTENGTQITDTAAC